MNRQNSILRLLTGFARGPIGIVRGSSTILAEITRRAVVTDTWPK